MRLREDSQFTNWTVNIFLTGMRHFVNIETFLVDKSFATQIALKKDYIVDAETE